MVNRPNYGNWVSIKLVYLFSGLALLFLISSFVWVWFFPVAALFLVCLAYVSYARQRFSSRGGVIQTQVLDLVSNHLSWDGQGRGLDIGCGNGPLIIKMAGQHPSVQMVGLDYWSGLWGYSVKTCRQNAELEGVAGRVAFLRASAAALPFKDSSFDAAVSNFVFHAVKEVKDKKELVKEALRVVKKGGKFAFQDLFLFKRFYGEVDDLIEAIKSWGVEEVEFIDTSGADFIPRLLKLPFMLGDISLIRGTK